MKPLKWVVAQHCSSKERRFRNFGGWYITSAGLGQWRNGEIAASCMAILCVIEHIFPILSILIRIINVISHFELSPSLKVNAKSKIYAYTFPPFMLPDVLTVFIYADCVHICFSIYELVKSIPISILNPGIGNPDQNNSRKSGKIFPDSRKSGFPGNRDSRKLKQMVPILEFDYEFHKVWLKECQLQF